MQIYSKHFYNDHHVNCANCMYKFFLIRSISNFFIYIILNKKLYKLYIVKVAMKIQSVIILKTLIR